MTELTAPAQGVPTELSTGSVIGDRFKVGDKYGSDSFARLYGATDTKTGRAISLRQLRAPLSTPGVVAALRSQVKAAGALKHPHVLGVFGVISGPDGSAVLVQDPVSGRNLADYVRSRQESGTPLTLRGAYNVVAHVANGLEALHALGPHGALRPGVVWITGDGTVSLMDFAMARAVLGSGDLSQIGEADLAYLSPEVRSGGPPGAPSDVFGLGALLYVLLTGRSPAEEFRRPSDAHPDADTRLDEALLRALSADPAARHATPQALCSALLPLMGGLEEANAADFGVDIDIDISLASMAPSMRPGGAATPHTRVPGSPRLPEIIGDPQAGARVSIEGTFRESIVDGVEAKSAVRRVSLASIDLADVLTKITENDDARWMLVKDGMDHGPFTGKQLVNMIVKGDALAEHGLMNIDTGERRKVKEFREFTEFLAQYDLRRKEADQKQAIAQAETSERRSTLFKVGVGAAIVAVLAMAGGTYLLTRGSAERADMGSENLGDLYQRGEIEVSGSAGILPIPKRRRGRSSGGSRGAGGGAMSYEQAMMQAVDIGGADQGGGEKQLSRSTIQGVMNRQLNSLFNACVKGSAGKVTIDMAILGNGSVQGVSVRANNPGLSQCVAGKVRGMRFPSFSAPRMGARFSFDT